MDISSSYIWRFNYIIVFWGAGAVCYTVSNYQWGEDIILGMTLLDHRLF